MTDQEIIEWVTGLIGQVASEFAVGPHDMDSDYEKLEFLKNRLHTCSPDETNV